MQPTTYHIDSAAQFYQELENILDKKSSSYDSPVSQVNTFLSLLAQYHDRFLDESGQDLEYCCYRLLDSNVFQCNTESSDEDEMWITYHVLLYASKELPKIYRWMSKVEFLRKLKDQIQCQKGPRMQLIAITMMYEMCRIQRLKECDLGLADENFINYMLDLVERTRTDATEQLNYSAIKLLLAFNEQYMLHTSNRSHHYQPGVQPAYTENILLTVLAKRLGRSATFGENLIFILNRAVIRELWDLPEEQESLRHAYLRVLGPLLTNTQLKRASYKRAEIVRLLRELGGGDLDSTLRRQLQEHQLQEQLLEQQRDLVTKLTYRDRESSAFPLSRWSSDRSGCSSPVLSAQLEKKHKGPEKSKLSLAESNSSGDLLKVPGQDEAEESLRQHLKHQDEVHDLQGDEDDGSLQIEVPKAQSPGSSEQQQYGSSSRLSQRIASPTTQRLVERVLREWLDNEMKNGGGTTGVGFSVRGVTDGHPCETSDGRIAVPVAQ
ncbi:hypothetical protein FBU30_003093 [Linnemannia zychae]|nr:hypothetical protein FBU30_003093 [Linnemannia zychae]